MSEAARPRMPRGVDRGVRDVLRLCQVPRAPGDIAFLLRESGGDSPAVPDVLTELEARGWVERSESGLRRLSELGLSSLRRDEECEVFVEDVFLITERPRPLIAGVIRRGTVHLDDYFLVNRERLGRVVSIEFGCGPEPRPDRVTLTADVDVEPGDVLAWHEPLVAQRPVNGARSMGR